MSGRGEQLLHRYTWCGVKSSDFSRFPHGKPRVVLFYQSSSPQPRSYEVTRVKIGELAGNARFVTMPAARYSQVGQFPDVGANPQNTRKKSSLPPKSLCQRTFQSWSNMGELNATNGGGSRPYRSEGTRRASEPLCTQSRLHGTVIPQRLYQRWGQPLSMPYIAEIVQLCSVFLPLAQRVMCHCPVEISTGASIRSSKGVTERNSIHLSSKD